MSAIHNLKHIGIQHKKQLIGTFTLVLLENLMLMTYPIFGGFAINGVVAGNLSQALTYSAVVLVMWLIGSARRAVDTRTFTRIYAAIVVPLIVQQRQQGELTSTVSARVALSREFVDFFEQHLPVLITSVISIAGAVLMLLVIEFWSGLTALVILLFFALLAPRYTHTNDRLYFKLNNHLENDVKMIERSHTPHLTRHYDFISRLRIIISNREALSYLLVGIAMAILFGVTMAILTFTHEVSAGHIYAVISYLWTFAMSLDDIPRLLEQFSQIKDIGKRVKIEEKRGS
ncbi:TPA: ABC transporter six-transmembrane domain-containing protein [Pasteurella multocida]|nr:ABC transporter six-transmembrane domain-containing protein [Pasteurella multocida]